MTKPTFTWSYSSLSLFQQCPKKYYHLRVAKDIVEPKSEQMLYGTVAHKAAEDYVRDGTPLESQFAYMQPTLDALKNREGEKLCEYRLGLTEALEPCEFFAPDVWWRGIADLIIVNDDNYTAHIVDYKTGNDKYPDRDQLVLMSLMVFKHFPHVKRVKSALLFVVKNTMVKHEMTIDEEEFNWWRYRERVARMAACHSNGVWNPNPTPLCPWCPVTSCEHNPHH